VPGVVADPPSALRSPRRPAGSTGRCRPFATAPASRARSTRCQSASESREGRPQRPGPASPARATLAPRHASGWRSGGNLKAAGDLGAGQAPGTGGLADGAARRQRKERDAGGLDEHASPGPLPHNTRSQRMPHHSTSSVTFPKTWSVGLPQLMRSEPGRAPGFARSAGRILSSGCTLTPEQGPPRASRGY
jgi:hypothetical protein